MSKKMYNHLIHETSPYLLQHANNPVEWYAWNDQSLALATSQDKLIFLSIGYSACHWCHVMAHESFEDEATAKLMNQNFINIKIDKEERPDIDKIYQLSYQILTQKTGGWPLSMFLTPQDHIPFFGGTYFPIEAQYALPSFKEILTKIADLYQRRRDSIHQQSNEFLLTFQTINKQKVVDPTITLTDIPFDLATQQLEQSFDAQFGGFGNAPKFPHPSNLEYLLRQYLRTDCSQKNIIDMANITLHKMGLGGLYDQLGGGFYRYSVDQQWMIPHFEKMLCDNGLLLTLYSQAYTITKIPLYQTIAKGIAEWVIREMQSPEGGYYSSLDADSEGLEGKFYTWDNEEIAKLLEQDEYAIFANYYNLHQPANFDDQWHLYVISEHIDEEMHPLLAQAKTKLLRHRETRVHPHCDDKILTAWNALMIKGMATIAFTFNSSHYLSSAEKALTFIYENMYKNGRLFATYRKGKAHINAYLDDYAFLIDAILTFLQCRWQAKWFDLAIQLADNLLELFFDEQQGGFFFTTHDHEQLIHRSQYFMDDSLPSGNGIAAYVLCKLSYLTGNPRYAEASKSVLQTAWSSIMQYPSAHSALLYALEENISPTKRCLIFTTTPASIWQNKLREHLTPFDNIMVLPADRSTLPDSLSKYNIAQLPVAYICDGHTCHEPILDINAIPKHLQRSATMKYNSN